MLLQKPCGVCLNARSKQGLTRRSHVTPAKDCHRTLYYASLWHHSIPLSWLLGLHLPSTLSALIAIQPCQIHWSSSVLSPVPHYLPFIWTAHSLVLCEVLFCHPVYAARSCYRCTLISDLDFVFISLTFAACPDLLPVFHSDYWTDLVLFLPEYITDVCLSFCQPTSLLLSV